MDFKIFVINLERSKARRRSISRSLEALGLEFEFIKAVDWRDLETADLPDSLGDAFVNDELHKSIYATAQSHRRALSRIVEDGTASALVLEDDVDLSGDFFSNDLAPRAIREGDVVLLRYFSNRDCDIHLASDGLEALDKKYSLADPVNVEALASAAAYLRKNDAAARFLSRMSGYYCADDWALFAQEAAVCNIKCVHPQPVSDVPFSSEIFYPDRRSPL